MTDGPTLERSVEVVNSQGFHARPAAEFVKLASRFSSEIHIARDGLEVNAKSIMGVLMLAAEKGSTLIVRAEGVDALDALDALADLVGRGFEET